MSFIQLRSTVVTAWALVIVGCLMVRAAALGSALSVPEIGGWLFLASAPAMMVFFVFRAAPVSIGQVLYDAEHAGDRDGRKLATAPVSRH